MRLTGWISLMILVLLLAPLQGGEKDKLDPAKLVGSWSYVSGESDGKKLDPKKLEKATVDITKDKMTLNFPDMKFVVKYEVDPSKTPAHIKMEILEGPAGKGDKADGIIAMKDGQITLCYPYMGGAMPKDFATKEKSGLHLFTLKKK